MDDFTLASFMAYLPRIALVIAGPILAHISYAVFARRKPTVALFLVSGLTLLWMVLAAPQGYEQGLGTYSNSAVSLYIFIAAGFLWFAHHQLIGRSALAPKLMFHIPVAVLFCTFGLLFWKFHVEPHLNALA